VGQGESGTGERDVKSEYISGKGKGWRSVESRAGVQKKPYYWKKFDVYQKDLAKSVRHMRRKNIRKGLSHHVYGRAQPRTDPLKKF